MRFKRFAHLVGIGCFAILSLSRIGDWSLLCVVTLGFLIHSSQSSRNVLTMCHIKRHVFGSGIYEE